MAITKNIPLVSSEVGGIWDSFIGESISVCLYKYFSNRVDDNEIRAILQSSLDLSNNNINKLTRIFNQENIPLPDGFTDNDINIDAPRLFTDDFYLQYLTYISGASMRYYSLILSQTARYDIRDYFSQCILENLEAFNNVCQLSLSKGIFIRNPHVEVPKEVQYIKSDSFILDWFGKKRSMLTDEITHIFSNVNANIVRKAILTGFYQVSKNKKVSDCLEKLKKNITEENNNFSSFLEAEEISVGGSSESYVTDSTISPFSDKFMLNKVMSMYRLKMSTLGAMIADITRSDLVITFMKYLNVSIIDNKDISSIMIDYGWLQQPPQAIKHEKLVEV